MHRYLWGQLRHRGHRPLALLLGMLVATTSFAVLIGTVRTSRLRVAGTVKASSRSAYDILVRPRGSTIGLERSRGLVRENYLSGIFGGISLRQYGAVRRISGVQVAAPIAMVGYVLQDVRVPVDLTDLLAGRRRQLFRVSVTRSTDRGLTRVRDLRSTYVYVTRRPLEPVTRFSAAQSVFGPTERLESGRRVVVCPAATTPRRASGPFDPGARERMDCWSTRSGLEARGFAGLPGGHVGALVDWPFPFLVAAIDPGPEAALAQVDDAIVDGRYLRAADRPTTVTTGVSSYLQVPVLVSTRPYADDGDAVTVSRLSAAAAATMTRGLGPERLDRRLSAAQGPIVRRRRIDATAAYRQLLERLSAGLATFVDSYWTVGAARYRQRGAKTLVPTPVDNPDAVWRSALQSTGFVLAPIDAADTAFRPVVAHVGSNKTNGEIRLPALHAVGRFDAARLPGFNPLSAVPLETYNPPTAGAVDARTDRLLGGRELLPNGNIAGYLQSPPLMLTTLASLSAFTNPAVFGRHTTHGAPISVIRVRVAGVTGADAVSRERVRVVAEEIAQRTGLDVDVTQGSSPTPMTIRLPAGRLGRPALSLREGWVKKGVAVAILGALDRKSVLLLALILAVCALYVANAAAAAVRTRRTELGVLACLGWRARKLFATVLLEVGLVGLGAGVIGALLAVALASPLGLEIPVERAALAVPAAVVLALVAAFVPARRAARADPAAAIRPAVQVVRRARNTRTVAGMAMTNLARAAGRSLLGALSLAVGVCALTLLLAVTLAFRGTVVGTLLGEAVSVQVRGVDYLAAAVTVVLGAAVVADVLYLNVRDRSAEFATLRAVGWREGPLARLVALEGVGMGLLGSVVGAGAGLALAAAFAGTLRPALVTTAAAGIAAGTLVAAAAVLLPVAMLRRLPTARALAEE